MNELSALLSRKKQLLKQRDVLKRSKQTEFIDGSNSDNVVEDSDTDTPPKIVCSTSRRNIALYSTVDSNPNDTATNTSIISYMPENYEILNNATNNLICFNNPIENSSISMLNEQQFIQTCINVAPDVNAISNLKVSLSQEYCPESTINDETSGNATNSSVICLPWKHQNDQVITYDELHNEVTNETTRFNIMLKALQPFQFLTEKTPQVQTTRMSKANIISDVKIQLPAKLNVECAPNRLDSKAVTLMELGENNTGSWKCCSMGVDTPTVTTDTVHEFVPEYPTGPKDIRDMDLGQSSNVICSKVMKGSTEVVNSLNNDNDSDQETRVVVNTSSPTLSLQSLVTRKQKERIASQFQKSYMDFMLEDDFDDFSCGSSDCWSPKDSEYESSSEKKNREKKRSKKNNSKEEKNQIPIKKTKLINKTKTRRALKEKGFSYDTKSGNQKESRQMKINPCKENKCPRRCYEITEERRQSIFNFFWSLDNQRKKEWIMQCACYITIKRKRTESPLSRRDKTIEYYINEGEGRRQVCQQFIKNTLDISQTYLLYNLSNSIEGISQKDKRTRHADNKYNENTYNFAKKYIEDLPVLPSHYNRQNSSKLYLSQDFKSVTNLYRLYVKYCEDNSHDCLSERLFRNLFMQYNITFHIPKKDKCKVCIKHENNMNVMNEKETYEYKNHLEEKKACYKRSEIHRNMVGKDNSTVIASFDLQKVLNTPHGQSMLLYYSRKYAVYNLTVYESKTQNGFCYTWGECDGKRGSCEIGTCLYKYLLDIDKRGAKYVIFYCDSCWGQNKNKVILSVFKYFLEYSNNVQVVQINYLLPGHSYMPVDSMHSVIEREVRKLIVWSPAQWPIFMLAARKTPRPYIVITLDHTDFMNWQIIAEQIFTPKTTSNPNFRMKDIRIATIKKTNLNEMEVKYTMKEDGDIFNIPLSQGMKTVTGKAKGTKKGIGKGNSNKVCDQTRLLQKLYAQRLPISKKKYMDLKKLCDDEVIPKQYKHEYLHLPFIEKNDYLDDIIQQGDDLTSENETEEQSGTKTQSDYDTKLNVQSYANEAENIEKAVKESLGKAGERKIKRKKGK